MFYLILVLVVVLAVTKYICFIYLKHTIVFYVAALIIIFSCHRIIFVLILLGVKYLLYRNFRGVLFAMLALTMLWAVYGSLLFLNDSSGGWFVIVFVVLCGVMSNVLYFGVIFKLVFVVFACDIMLGSIIYIFLLNREHK